MAGYEHISPTFISTEAFTPAQLDRATLPYHGYQPCRTYPLDGNNWGSGVTGYSGLGSFTYHGNTYVKDLPAGRTHRHYNSGILQGDCRLQPRRRTDLRRADCRLNDQLLPKPLDMPFDPVATNPRLLMRGQDPWYPFKSIFSVIPLPSQRRVDNYGTPLLSKTTDDTLTNYYHHLHDTPRYHDTYQDYYKQRIRDTWDPNRQAPPIYSRPHPFLPQFGDKPYALPQHSPPAIGLTWNPSDPSPGYHKTVCKSVSDSAIGFTTQANTQLSNRATEESNSTSEKDVQKLLTALLEIYGQCVVDQLMRSPDFPDNAWSLLARSTKPVWPPGPTYTVNTKTMQLPERGQLNTNLWCDLPETETALPPSNPRRPETTGIFQTPAAQMSYYDQINGTNVCNQHKLTQPRYEPDNIDSKVTPLRGYLQPTGNRVSDRLGLPFKTMAQRRFHELHREHIPDLRENHRTSKKYHFLGMHGAAAFRGQCTGVPFDSQAGHSSESHFGYHGQCSAPLLSCCANQKTQLPPVYNNPVEKDRQMHRWKECFIERLV